MYIRDSFFHSSFLGGGIPSFFFLCIFISLGKNTGSLAPVMSSYVCTYVMLPLLAFSSGLKLPLVVVVVVVVVLLSDSCAVFW